MRVRFSGAGRAVTDGPFAETKELLAGFWLWQVESMDEAIEWVERCPNPMPGESEIEIRPVFDPEDFAAERPLGKSHTIGWNANHLADLAGWAVMTLREVRST